VAHKTATTTSKEQTKKPFNQPKTKLSKKKTTTNQPQNSKTNNHTHHPQTSDLLIKEEAMEKITIESTSIFSLPEIQFS